MSLMHEFFLLPKEEIETEDWIDWYSTNRYSWTEKLEIDDFIIHYILDSLNWIPTKNPYYEGEFKGLSYYGVTLISNESSQIMINIIQSWVHLFSNAPEKFKLKGLLCWKEEEENSEGYWEHEIIDVHRNKLIGALNKLILFAEKVKNENYFIMHYGI